MASASHGPGPARRFLALVALERRDLAAILGYTLVTGLLALAVPLAAQALVNTVAVGVFLQPLVVLTGAVLVLLLFRGLLRLLKLYLIEVLQQRVFTRVALDLAEHLHRIRTESLMGAYAPDLANRFFDVLTVQKSWAKLLLEGPAAILQSLVGLLLMAFYSPLLLAFDVVLVASGLVVLGAFGWGGLSTSIQESAEKYRVARWLEEIGRSERSLKFSASPDFAVRKADRLVESYLDARGRHFRVLLRQAFGSYLLHALASAGILAAGGWLVIQRQLTLGQLVASELIVVSVLSAIEKLIRLAEPWYDLLTAREKIGQVLDLPREEGGPVPLATPHPPGGIRLCSLGYRYPDGTRALVGVDLDFEPGSRTGITGPGGSGKTTLLRVIAGLLPPSEGTIRLDGRALGEHQLEGLRARLSLVGDRFDVFEGTLEENLRVGRERIDEAQLREVIAAVDLDADLARLPLGLQSPIQSEGRNLSGAQVQRLLLARALLGGPGVLLIDDALQGLEPAGRRRFLDGLCRERTSTVLLVSHEPEILSRCDRILYLDAGRVVEAITPDQLGGSSQTVLFLGGHRAGQVAA